MPEIWLYGLRNPWRIRFDRATGDLWIGDVGQDAWEEIDVARAGVGGLRTTAGTDGRHPLLPARASGCDQTGLTLPVTEYDHEPRLRGHRRGRGARRAEPRRGLATLFGDDCSGNLG